MVLKIVEREVYNMANNNKCKNFYLKCTEEGIKKPETRAEIARMVLTAKNNGISGTEEELIVMFKEGKAIVECADKENKIAKAERKAKERLDNIRNTEKEDVAYIKKIASFSGVEKPIYFLKEQISISKELKEDYRKEREDAVKMGVALYHAGKMKEKDWAICGGIAGGLAGGAAGLATALDAQRHNAQAREYNKQLMSSVAGMMSPLTPGVQREADMDKDIQQLREKIEKYRKKLVEYLSPIELLIRLSPKLKEQRVTETGAVRLTVETKAARDVAIYDEVKAVIDGSFKALLLDNEEVVGEAIFVLPFGGAWESEEVDSICIDVKNTENKTYDVVFVPNKLWAIETKGTIKNKETDIQLSEECFKSITYYVRDAISNNSLCEKDYEMLISVVDKFPNPDKVKKLIKDFKEKMESVKTLKEQKEKASKRNRKITMIVSSIVVAIIAIVMIANVIIKAFVIPANKYNEAVILEQNGEYAKAILLFEELKDYKDSEEHMLNILTSKTEVAEQFVTAGLHHSVALKMDGTVIAVGENGEGQCNVAGWNNIIAVSAGNYHTVGLRTDGTVVATTCTKDYADYNQCNVSEWADIIAISAGHLYTVGLKADGTVVAVGENKNGQCNVSNWADIVSISAGAYHTVGLKSDGTVVAEGANFHGECDVFNWKAITSVSAGSGHTVGLKSNGTVVAIGDNEYGQCNVQEWKDIVSISTGTYDTVGLKSDGTVVTTRGNNHENFDFSDWTGIIATARGNYHSIGLGKDGTVVAVGANNKGECDVSGWNLFE